MPDECLEKMERLSWSPFQNTVLSQFYAMKFEFGAKPRLLAYGKKYHQGGLYYIFDFAPTHNVYEKLVAKLEKKENAITREMWKQCFLNNIADDLFALKSLERNAEFPAIGVAIKQQEVINATGSVDSYQYPYKSDETARSEDFGL